MTDLAANFKFLLLAFLFAFVGSTQASSIDAPVLLERLQAAYLRNERHRNEVASVVSPEALERSVVSWGAWEGVARILAKAAMNQSITILILGGSSAAGAALESPSEVFGVQFAQWLSSLFNNPHINVVNSAVGSTGE
jgi:hypothetical protein